MAQQQATLAIGDFEYKIPTQGGCYQTRFIRHGLNISIAISQDEDRWTAQVRVYHKGDYLNLLSSRHENAISIEMAHQWALERLSTLKEDLPFAARDARETRDHYQRELDKLESALSTLKQEDDTP
jgi:hypothetical protein